MRLAVNMRKQKLIKYHTINLILTKNNKQKKIRKRYSNNLLINLSNLRTETSMTTIQKLRENKFGEIIGKNIKMDKTLIIIYLKIIINDIINKIQV